MFDVGWFGFPGWPDRKPAKKQSDGARLNDLFAEESHSDAGPAKDVACLRRLLGYALVMPSATASKPVASRGHRTSGRKLTGAEIRSRFEQVELATVSALRALQMDVEGDEGTPSATVLKRARAGLR
jgi:hypothetical protein